MHYILIKPRGEGKVAQKIMSVVCEQIESATGAAVVDPQFEIVPSGRRFRDYCWMLKFGLDYGDGIQEPGALFCKESLTSLYSRSEFNIDTTCGFKLSVPRRKAASPMQATKSDVAPWCAQLLCPSGATWEPQSV